MVSGGRTPYGAELAAAIDAATAAGRAVRAYYEQASARTYDKNDGSPVTDADLAADRVIREVLSEQFPGDPILTEEGGDDKSRLASRRCWIADPIDGTEQFILRTDEFDVLVALVIDGRPVAAAACQPATGLLISASLGQGAWVHGIDGSMDRLMLEPAGERIRLATSKWFGAPENAPMVARLAAALGTEAQPPMVTGFSPRIFLPPRALDAMLGVRPEGNQDMASEWDFAAVDLVIHEAGGMVTDLAGERFRYNKPEPRNEGGLIAAADPTTHARILSACGAMQAPLPHD
jgi:myo-inositol-1(or 4)-monophosphatase